MENESTHVHSFTDTVVPPTCKERGYTLHRCECGYEYKDSYKPVGPHSYEVIEEKAPTCTEHGFRTYRCSVCGETNTQTLPAGDHAWGNWNVSIYPSCTESGAEYRICGRCGMREDRIIPPTGHKLTNPRPSETDSSIIEYFCENCGETIAVPVAEEEEPVPERRGKKRLVKRVTVIAAIAVVISLLCVFLSGPFHYYIAQLNIKNGKYESAYQHLMKSGDFKNSYRLLSNFGVGYRSIQYISYDDDGEVESDYKLKYNKHGNLVSRVYKSEDGEENSYKYTHEYDLDRDGNVESVISYDSSGEFSSHYEYEYDKNNNTTLEVSYDDAGNVLEKTRYSYDKNSNLVKIISEDAEGYSTSVTEYKYDKHGNVTKQVRYDEYGEEEYEDEIKYKYDKRGNVTSFEDEEGYTYKIKYNWRGGMTLLTCYDEDDEKVGTIKLKYDLMGNVTEFKYESIDQDEDDEYDDGSSTEIEIEYDLKGNPTKIVLYDEEEDEKSTVKLEYDRKGYLKEAKYYNDDGDLTSEIKYEDPIVRYSSTNQRYSNNMYYTNMYYTMFGPKFYNIMSMVD